MTAHLRMNAIYWGLTALCVMDHKDALNREEMIEFVMSCWDEEAGLFECAHYMFQATDSLVVGVFGPHPDHDGHLIVTSSAVQVLMPQGPRDRLYNTRVSRCK